MFDLLCTGTILIILHCMLDHLRFRWQNNLTNNHRETSSSNRSVDLAADDGSRITSSPPVATTHDDQEHYMSQVELPVPSAKAALEEMLRVLFEEVCFGLRLSQFFNGPDASSFFVIYAHDNPTLGRADSRVVRQLISHLNGISSKCRSDRGATLSFDASGSRARQDILENQFCILPESVSDTSVDKIILFYSEALQTCCVNEEGRKYVEELRCVNLHEYKDSGHGLHDEASVLSDMPHSAKARIRAVVESRSTQPWFHHVLTEIGLVGLRIAWDKHPYAVIAVNLHSIKTISDDLGFIGRTQHYLSVPPLESVLINEAERYHRLFFDLLDKIHESIPQTVHLIRQHYREGLASLKAGRSESLTEFRKAIRFEITENINIWGKHQPQSRASKNRSDTKSPPLHQPLPNPAEQQAILKRLNCTARNLSPPRETEHKMNPGSLHWLTNHPAYLEWLSRDNGMLGLRGGPGTGKSTAINHLLQRSCSEGGKTHINLAFSFHFSGEFMDRSSVGMYSTLLYKLLSEFPQFGTEFWKWMDKFWSKEAPPDASDLRELLLLALKRAIKEAPVRIFLDALDEAGDPEARGIIADLRHITNVPFGIPKGLSICFSCRSYPAFTVDNGPEIDFGGTHGDKIVLPRGPESLNELYRNIIIDKNTRGGVNGLAVASMLLQIIHFSRRVLSLQELRCILVSNESFMALIRDTTHGSWKPLKDEIAMMDMLKSHLGDLAQIVDTVDESGNIQSVVKFIHLSVCDWHSKPDELAKVFTIPKMPASTWVGLGHHLIAGFCYSHIKASYKEWHSLNFRESEARFGYAIEFWFDHAARAEAKGISQAYLKDELAGGEDGRLLETWASAYRRKKTRGHSLPPTPSVFDIGMAFGIHSLLE